jgi:hypothetical protein
MSPPEKKRTEQESEKLTPFHGRPLSVSKEHFIPKAKKGRAEALPLQIFS